MSVGDANQHTVDLDKGGRGTGRTPMDWEARMRTALCAARGLAHLHTAHSLVHGNVKASNLLLRPDPDAAALSDYCLHQIFPPAPARPGGSGGGYRAPELVDARRPTFRSDVSSLGVLFLELLTGKSPAHHASLEGSEGAVDLPRWVQSVVREEWTAEVFDVELLRYRDIEEEMVAMLHVALACVAPQPEQRPSMGDVVRMIESVPVDQSPMPEEDRDVSVTSPSIGITTDDGGARLSY